MTKISNEWRRLGFLRSGLDRRLWRRLRLSDLVESTPNPLTPTTEISDPSLPEELCQWLHRRESSSRVESPPRPSFGKSRVESRPGSIQTFLVLSSLRQLPLSRRMDSSPVGFLPYPKKLRVSTDGCFPGKLFAGTEIALQMAIILQPPICINPDTGICHSTPCDSHCAAYNSGLVAQSSRELFRIKI